MVVDFLQSPPGQVVVGLLTNYVYDQFVRRKNQSPSTAAPLTARS
jgi:hypothetical protein